MDERGVTQTGAQVALSRLLLTLFGAIAALALWGLSDNWDNGGVSPSLSLASFTFVGVYAAVVLAVAGPVSPVRALAGALVLAVPVTLLVSWAGLRHGVATEFLDDPVMLVAVGVLLLLATPFLLIGLRDPARWLDYGALFSAAWGIVARYVMAGCFVGMVWLLLLLSDTLLRLVEIQTIGKLIATDWAPFVLSGAMLGLAMATLYELRGRFSPFLMLRLLRLMLPPVLAVLAIFVLAVPFQGLGKAFGDYSLAATLLVAVGVAITLISAAVDRDDRRSEIPRIISLSARGLALLLPVPAGLALGAVVLRVGQYGWTPDRILAMTAAVVAVIYAMGYMFSVLRRPGWKGRIRRVNTGLAGLVLLVSALWLTPLFNVYRMSTESQLARFEDGQTPLEGLALWEMAHDWGKAGQDGLQRLEAMQDRPDHDALMAAIAVAREERNRFQAEQARREQATPVLAERLAARLAVRPEGQPALAAGQLAGFPFYKLDQWLSGCDIGTGDGRVGCVFLWAPLLPGETRQGAILYREIPDRTRIEFLAWPDGQPPVIREMHEAGQGGWPVLGAGLIGQVLDGGYSIDPADLRALSLGGLRLIPGN